MEVYKIDIESWTASFRYPNLISGVQPTLEVPPLSTILGLINAAAGQYLHHKELQIGYYFEYESEGEDLETIYQISSKNGQPTNNAKSNILYRKFLFNNFLRIYTTDIQIRNYLSNPHFQLLLGRMNDLATVVNISDRVQLTQNEYSMHIRGQIIPFQHYLPGQIQALPQYFSDEFPRKNLCTEPYSIISSKSNDIEASIMTYQDVLPNGKEIDIFFHQLNFE